MNATRPTPPAAGLHLSAGGGKRPGGATAPTHDQIENRLRGQQLALQAAEDIHLPAGMQGKGLAR